MAATSSVYRRELIAAGKLTESTSAVRNAPSGHKVLKLDAAGTRAALRHIEEGERGAKLMMMPMGLSPWHAEALATQERKRSA